jgi:hypothetical protein
LEELGSGSLIGQLKLMEQLDAPQNLFVSLVRNIHFQLPLYSSNWLGGAHYFDLQQG